MARSECRSAESHKRGRHRPALGVTILASGGAIVRGAREGAEHQTMTSQSEYGRSLVTPTQPEAAATAASSGIIVSAQAGSAGISRAQLVALLAARFRFRAGFAEAAVLAIVAQIGTALATADERRRCPSRDRAPCKCRSGRCS